MALSPENIQKVERHIQLLLAESAAFCRYCGRTDYSIHENMLTYNVADLENKTLVPGASYPVIAVYCKNCGHIETFSPVVIGLIPPIS